MRSMFEQFIVNQMTKSLASPLNQMEEISRKAHVAQFSCVQTQNSWGLSNRITKYFADFLSLPNFIFLLLLNFLVFQLLS